jgi:hypothetical protein
MKLIAFAAATAALTLLAPSLGQAQAAPSAAQLALGRQIVEAQGGVANMSALAHNMSQSLMTAMGQNMPADQKQALQSAVDEVMVQMVPRALQISEQIYAGDFTEGQLKDMLAFYTSPTGRALAARLPEISQQTGAAMQQMSPAIQLKMLTLFCQKTTCPAELKAGIAQLDKSVPGNQRF